MLLLDTNIVSYSYKQHSIWNLYFPMTLGRELFLSFQTIAELTEGSIVAKLSMQKRSKLEVFLRPSCNLHRTCARDRHMFEHIVNHSPSAFQMHGLLRPHSVSISNS
jgi:hypothetical protein